MNLRWYTRMGMQGLGESLEQERGERMGVLTVWV